MKAKMLTLAVVAMCVKTVVSSVVFRVEEDHCAVVVHSRHGVKDQVYGPGLHFINPLCEKTVIYDVSRRLFFTETSCLDIYQRKISMAVDVIASFFPSELPKLYQKLGAHNEEGFKNVIADIIKNLMKTEKGNHILSNVEEISSKIRIALMERASYVDVDYVSIRQFAIQL